MSTERLIADKTQYSDNGTHRHLPRSCSSSSPLIPRIFEELPKATIVSVLKPETTDFSPMLLSYNIELKYKQACFLSLYFSVLDCFIKFCA